jgi:predicted ATPase
MSLPVDRYPQLDLTPTKQKIETITVLVDYLVKFSHNSSVIVLVEDIHWIDPSTLEVFDAFVDSLQQLQVLLVMTHRPGLEKRWQEFGHVTHHSLNRLGHKEMRALVDRITDGKALPENVLEQILERTDGMPLFVEELIKTLLESQVVREVDGRYVIESVLPSMAIPTTLRDSLMARLDRLGLVKEVAQAAACIGREFSYALLTSIVDTDDLDDKLDQLVGAGLIFRRGSRDLARFVFKHALVQDAAYESLLKTKRRNLHARIAKLLEEEFSDKAEIEPELLAHHYTEAGLDEPALQYWLRAGQQSIKQCAHAEAIAHLRRGLSIVDALPEGEEKTRSEIEFRVVLGVPLMGKEGGASPLVDENYLRAQMLCEQLGESEHLYPILWGLWYHRYLSSELRQACELADRLLEIGQIRNDTELLLEAHHCQWVVRFIGGDLTTALEECDRGVELYRPETHHALSFTYGGHDPGVCALNFSGVSLWLLGYPEQSLEKLESAISLATKLAHSETLTTTFQFFLVACTLQRDEDVIEQKAKELLKFAEDEELFDSINLTKGLIGLVMFQRGDKQEGLEFMLESVGRWLKKSSPWSAVSISLVAESLGQMGEATKGLKMVEDTISLGQRREVHWCEAELYRVKGKLLLSISTEAPSGAEDAFQRAIEIAREQNAKSLELRAAVDLARLWKAGEKTDQARELLRPIYDWFTEGFDTTDLRQAKALLEELT